MKKPEVLLREYVRKLNEADLNNLHKYYGYNLSADRAEIAHIYSSDKEMDKWLSSATSADEWFDMVETAGEYIQREYQWRNDRSRRKKEYHNRSRSEG
jgi:hypothetical protein